MTSRRLDEIIKSLSCLPLRSLKVSNVYHYGMIRMVLNMIIIVNNNFQSKYMSYLSTEDILTPKQYGFRPASTTTDCFISRFNRRNYHHS